MKTITITYNPRTCGIEGGDLYGYLWNELDNAKVQCRIKEGGSAARLRKALQRAFNLIKESGFRSGLTEEEFDATLKQCDIALAKGGK
jgi:hypothetical protein